MNHTPAPKQILVPKAVLCKRNIRFLHCREKLEKSKRAEPSMRKRVPKGFSTGAADMKPAAKLNETVDVDKYVPEHFRHTSRYFQIVYRWPLVRGVVEIH